MNSIPVNSPRESTMRKGHTVAGWRRRALEGRSAGSCTQTCSVGAQKREYAVTVYHNLRRPPHTLGAQEWALVTSGQVPGGSRRLRGPGRRCWAPVYEPGRYVHDRKGRPLHSLMFLDDPTVNYNTRSSRVGPVGSRLQHCTLTVSVSRRLRGARVDHVDCRLKTVNCRL